MYGKEHTAEAPQVVYRHLPRRQPEFYRLFHQKDMKAPSKHQSKPLHHSNGLVAEELAMQVSPNQMSQKQQNGNYLILRLHGFLNIVYLAL